MDTNTADLTRRDVIFLLNSAKPRLEGVCFDGLDLSGLNFDELNLRGCSFKHCKLEGATFHKSELSEADFTGAAGRRPDFSEAALEHVTFDGAKFVDADFSGARLFVTSFQNAELHSTDFTEAKIADATFAGATLRGTMWGGESPISTDWEGANLSDNGGRLFPWSAASTKRPNTPPPGMVLGNAEDYESDDTAETEPKAEPDRAGYFPITPTPKALELLETFFELARTEVKLTRPSPEGSFDREWFDESGTAKGIPEAAANCWRGVGELMYSRYVFQLVDESYSGAGEKSRASDGGRQPDDEVAGSESDSPDEAKEGGDEAAAGQVDNEIKSIYVVDDSTSGRDLPIEAIARTVARADGGIDLITWDGRRWTPHVNEIDSILAVISENTQWLNCGNGETLHVAGLRRAELREGQLHVIGPNGDAMTVPAIEWLAPVMLNLSMQQSAPDVWTAPTVTFDLSAATMKVGEQSQPIPSGLRSTILRAVNGKAPNSTDANAANPTGETS